MLLFLCIKIKTRAFKICSNEKFFDAEVKFLTSYLPQNGFPCNFVKNMFRRAVNFIYNPEPINLLSLRNPSLSVFLI